MQKPYRTPAIVKIKRCQKSVNGLKVTGVRSFKGLCSVLFFVCGNGVVVVKFVREDNGATRRAIDSQ